MRFRYIPLLGLLLLFTGCGSKTDNEWDRVIKFKDQWKFSIGDDFNWANPAFDDGDWENILVPSPWEDEGYHGYDGYGWYRRSLNSR